MLKQRENLLKHTHDKKRQTAYVQWNAELLTEGD